MTANTFQPSESPHGRALIALCKAFRVARKPCWSKSPRARDGGAPLPQQDAGATDLLGAQRAQERRQDLVHQLEVGRERGGVLLRAVEHFFVDGLAVERR